MGRDKLSPSIHNLNTSQALVKIQTVSGYVMLTTYHLIYCILSILVDILQILSSTDPVEMSFDTIDRRLDDFLLQFQVEFN